MRVRVPPRVKLLFLSIFSVRFSEVREGPNGPEVVANQLAPAEQNKEVIEVIEKPYSVKQVAPVE